MSSWEGGCHVRQLKQFRPLLTRWKHWSVIFLSYLDPTGTMWIRRHAPWIAHRWQQAFQQAHDQSFRVWTSSSTTCHVRRLFPQDGRERAQVDRLALPHHQTLLGTRQEWVSAPDGLWFLSPCRCREDGGSSWFLSSPIPNLGLALMDADASSAVELRFQQSESPCSPLSLLHMMNLAGVILPQVRRT